MSGYHGLGQNAIPELPIRASSRRLLPSTRLAARWRNGAGDAVDSTKLTTSLPFIIVGWRWLGQCSGANGLSVLKRPSARDGEQVYVTPHERERHEIERCHVASGVDRVGALCSSYVVRQEPKMAVARQRELVELARVVKVAERLAVRH